MMRIQTHAPQISGHAEVLYQLSYFALVFKPVWLSDITVVWQSLYPYIKCIDKGSPINCFTLLSYANEQDIINCY